METPIIIIADLLGKSNAILHSEGLKVAEKLSTEFKGEPIAISFRDLGHVTTAFLHASIGNFLQDAAQYGSPKKLLADKLVEFVGVEENSTLDIQLKRAIARAENPQLKKIEDEVLEEYHIA